MADGSHETHKYNGGEFSTAEFTARERARLRKLVRDDDLAVGVRTTILKWAAIGASIVSFVLLTKEYIREFLKWVVKS